MQARKAAANKALVKGLRPPVTVKYTPDDYLKALVTSTGVSLTVKEVNEAYLRWNPRATNPPTTNPIVVSTLWYMANGAGRFAEPYDIAAIKKTLTGPVDSSWQVGVRRDATTLFPDVQISNGTAANGDLKTSVRN